MAESGTNMIDGFATVRAVRHAHTGSRRSDAGGAREKAPESVPVKRGVSTAGRPKLSHTVMPERFDIGCYACGYRFTITGRLEKVFCPKCREALDAADRTIATEWSGEIRTIGTVNVSADALLSGGRIVARNVNLAGRARGVAMEIAGRLDLCGTAQLEPGACRLNDVRVKADGCITLGEQLVCRNLDVAGELKASIVIRGTATIRAGGVLRGELSGEHLVVEDGGGLTARISIQPSANNAGSAKAGK